MGMDQINLKRLKHDADRKVKINVRRIVVLFIIHSILYSAYGITSVDYFIAVAAPLCLLSLTANYFLSWLVTYNKLKALSWIANPGQFAQEKRSVITKMIIMFLNLIYGDRIKRLAHS